MWVATTVASPLLQHMQQMLGQMLLSIRPPAVSTSPLQPRQQARLEALR